MRKPSSRMLGVLLASGTMAGPAAAQQWTYGPSMMGDHAWWGMFFGPFAMIAVVAAIIAVIVLLVRWLGGSGHGHGAFQQSRRTALDILRERFARGEIDKEEFEARRRILDE